MKLSLNPKRVFYVMCVLTIMVIGLAVAAIVVGNSFLQKQSDKLVSQKLQYRIPEANQTSIKKAKADIKKYTDLGNIAKTIVPQDKDQAQTVREIINFASQTYDPATKTNVKILSISFPNSTLGQAKAAPAPSTPVSNSAADSTGAAPKVVTPPLTQVQPVTGINGVYLLPVTVVSDPSYPLSFNQLVQFLSLLEQNRRTAQVSQISITPIKDSNNSVKGLSFTLTVNVYIKP